MLGAVSPDSFDTLHSYCNTFQMPFVTPWFPEKVRKFIFIIIQIGEKSRKYGEKIKKINFPSIILLLICKRHITFVFVDTPKILILNK